MSSRDRLWRLAPAAAFTLLTLVSADSSSQAPEPPQGDPDVVLITVDTLRADAVGYAGNPNVETPNIDGLAREGRLFPNAHAHNVVTLPSHANILTGLHPFQHGVRDNGTFSLKEGVPTVASLLGDAGYATGAFVAAFPLDARFGLNRGFDVYDDKYHEAESPTAFVTPERPAGEVIAAALQWYRSQKGRKRFLWVHLFEPHAPYQPPTAFREAYRKKPYLGEVAAADAALSELLAEARRGAPGSTLVVFTSDHGEALGDHGEMTHSLFAYESTLRIPLILWSPGRIEAKVDFRPARHVDIVPTILEETGTAIPPGLPGRSLLGPPDLQALTYFEALTASFNYGWAPLRGVLLGSRKAIALPVPELYDLAPDPMEQENLQPQDPAGFQGLEARIPEASRGSSEQRELSASERARLEALGYLAGDATAPKDPGPGDDPKNLVHLDRKLQRVLVTYQRGDLQNAAKLAREVIAERPDMELAHRYLGFILHQGDNFAAAEAAMREALSMGHDSDEIVRRLALVLTETGRGAQAVELLKDRARTTSSPEILNTYAIALAESGRVAQSQAIFARALELDPTYGEAYQNMGIAALKRGDTERAEKLLEQALEIDDRLPETWNTLGVIRAQKEDLEGALEAWTRAVEIDPRQFHALFNAGVVALRLGRGEAAAQALQRFVDTAPPGRFGSDIEKARSWLEELQSPGAKAK